MGRMWVAMGLVALLGACGGDDDDDFIVLPDAAIGVDAGWWCSSLFNSCNPVS